MASSKLVEKATGNLSLLSKLKPHLLHNPGLVFSKWVILSLVSNWTSGGILASLMHLCMGHLLVQSLGWCNPDIIFFQCPMCCLQTQSSKMFPYHRWWSETLTPAFQLHAQTNRWCKAAQRNYSTQIILETKKHLTNSFLQCNQSDQQELILLTRVLVYSYLHLVKVWYYFKWKVADSHDTYGSELHSTHDKFKLHFPASMVGHWDVNAYLV